MIRFSEDEIANILAQYKEGDTIFYIDREGVIIEGIIESREIEWFNNVLGRGNYGVNKKQELAIRSNGIFVSSLESIILGYIGLGRYNPSKHSKNKSDLI